MNTIKRFISLLIIFIVAFSAEKHTDANIVVDVQSNGELCESPAFLGAGLKFAYTFPLNGAKIQIFSGIKNIFNSFQKDFDMGIDRDPAYIYGPVSPRTIYLGINLGNTL